MKQKAQQQQPESAVPRLMDTDAAAQYLGVSKWTIRAFIANGDLPVVKLPSVKYQSRPNRRVLIDRTDIDALILKRKEVGA